MGLAVGDPAPTFTLAGVDGPSATRAEFSLEQFRGQPVVLVFYPGDNTPVCTQQLNAYSQDVTRFVEVGAQVLAISPQSVDSHVEFSGRQGGFAFPLLADEERKVGHDYGIVGPLGFYRRSIFVVDGEGIVAYVHRAVAGVTFQPTEALLDAVRAAVSA